MIKEKKALGRNCHWWLKFVGDSKKGGRYELDEDERKKRGKADTARRMFALAFEGFGSATIHARLKEEGLGDWTKRQIADILPVPPLTANISLMRGKTETRSDQKSETATKSFFLHLSARKCG